MDLSDGTTVNFLYEVHGLHSFRYEYQHAEKMNWLGVDVSVLPLARIYASKKFVGPPKDLAQLPLLEQIMRLQRELTTRARKPTRD